MTRATLPKWLGRIGFLAMACAAAGCSSSDGTTTTPATGTYALAVTPASVSGAAGGSAVATLAINRNAFTEAVALAVSGLPSGVTASFSGNNTTGNAAVLTLSIGAAVPVGSYSLTISGIASGVANQSATLTLVVTASTGGSGGFSVAASAVTVANGSTGTVTVTVTRTGAFTGTVTLAVGGLPAGVTGTFQPVQILAGQSVSTLSLPVTSAAALGTTTITITGSAAGLANQTASVQLTITAPAPAGPFAMALSVSSYLALPPTALAWLPVLKIARNAGFTSPVTFTVSGLPLTLAVLVGTVTADSAVLEVLNLGAANGTYTATIHGTGGGGVQTATMQIVVASPTTGAIKWTICPNGLPVWSFSVRDGNGAWTRIVPNADGSVFAFDITQPTASVALVTTDSGVGRTTVYQFTAAEVAARAASECALFPGATNRTVNGTVTGLAGGDLSTEGMGWWVGSTGGNAAYSLENLPSGLLDLVAARASLDALVNYAVSGIIIRRGVNPPSGGNNPVLDFGAAEAFAPTVSTWTFGNTGGAAFGVSQRFTTAAAIGSLSLIPGLEQTVTTRSIYGVPLGQTIAGDLHQVVATIGTYVPGGPSRQIITYARTLADRSLSFGSPMPTPTVSSVGNATAGRLRVQGTLPPEYNAGVSIEVKSTGANARFATVHTTRGFLGAGSTYDVQMPDLTSTTGWDSAWNIHPGDLTNWWASGGGPILHFFDARYIYASAQVRWTGAATGVIAPADGATYLIGRTSGSIVP